VNKAQIAESRSDQLVLTTKVGLVVIVFAAILLLTLNLTSTPEPWFDEGVHVNAAATLAKTGKYALPDATGLKVLDPGIQVGPTVILPVALSFKLFGQGYWQARGIIVLYGFLALAAYLLVARKVAGIETGLLALALLLAGNGVESSSFVLLSRQVVGEVPALGFLLLGLWCWFKGVETPGKGWLSRSNLFYLTAGLFFGLSIVTKLQVLLIFVPVWGLLFLADRFYYRQASWKAFILPGLVAVLSYGVWYGLQTMLADPETARQNAEFLRQSFTNRIVGFNPTHIREALGSLWRNGFLLWGLPGFLYGLYLTFQRDRLSLYRAGLVLFSGVWLVWFVGFSVGWPRYSFIGLALLPIWSAKLVVDFTTGKLLPSRSKWQIYLVGIIFSAWLAFGATATLGDIFNPPPNYLTQFATYLKENVPQAAVVANWEWELDLAAPQNFLHPSTSTLNEFISAKSDYRPFTYRYIPGSITPEYVVDGLFSNWSAIYLPYLQEHGEKMVQIGPYALYKVVNNK